MVVFGKGYTGSEDSMNLDATSDSPGRESTYLESEMPPRRTSLQGQHSPLAYVFVFVLFVGLVYILLNYGDVVGQAASTEGETCDTVSDGSFYLSDAGEIERCHCVGANCAKGSCQGNECKVMKKITINPGGGLVSLDGGAAQTQIFEFDSTVGTRHALAATPPPGSSETRFLLDTWVPELHPLSDIVVTRDATYIPQWKTQHQLTVAVNPADGSGGAVEVVNGVADGWYDEGTPVMLRATATTDYEFGSWATSLAGECSAVGQCEVTLDGPKTVTATFSPRARCGDGIVQAAGADKTAGTEDDEECDGDEVSCLGGTTGTPTCTQCKIDRSACQAAVQEPYNLFEIPTFTIGPSFRYSGTQKERLLIYSAMTLKPISDNVARAQAELGDFVVAPENIKTQFKYRKGGGVWLHDTAGFLRDSYSVDLKFNNIGGGGGQLIKSFSFTDDSGNTKSPMLSPEELGEYCLEEVSIFICRDGTAACNDKVYANRVPFNLQDCFRLTRRDPAYAIPDYEVPLDFGYDHYLFESAFRSPQYGKNLVTACSVINPDRTLRGCTQGILDSVRTGGTLAVTSLSKQLNLPCPPNDNTCRPAVLSSNAIQGGSGTLGWRLNLKHPFISQVTARVTTWDPSENIWKLWKEEEIPFMAEQKSDGSWDTIVNYPSVFYLSSSMDLINLNIPTRDNYAFRNGLFKKDNVFVPLPRKSGNNLYCVEDISVVSGQYGFYSDSCTRWNLKSCVGVVFTDTLGSHPFQYQALFTGADSEDIPPSLASCTGSEPASCFDTDYGGAPGQDTTKHVKGYVLSQRDVYPSAGGVQKFREIKGQDQCFTYSSWYTSGVSRPYEHNNVAVPECDAGSNCAVAEYYCDSNGNVKTDVTYRCTNGCRDGACIGEILPPDFALSYTSPSELYTIPNIAVDLKLKVKLAGNKGKILYSDSGVFHPFKMSNEIDYTNLFTIPSFIVYGRTIDPRSYTEVLQPGDERDIVVQVKPNPTTSPGHYPLRFHVTHTESGDNPERDVSNNIVRTNMHVARRVPLMNYRAVLNGLIMVIGDDDINEGCQQFVADTTGNLLSLVCKVRFTAATGTYRFERSLYSLVAVDPTDVTKSDPNAPPKQLSGSITVKDIAAGTSVPTDCGPNESCFVETILEPGKEYEVEWKGTVVTAFS